MIEVRSKFKLRLNSAALPHRLLPVPWFDTRDFPWEIMFSGPSEQALSGWCAFVLVPMTHWYLTVNPKYHRQITVTSSHHNLYIYRRCVSRFFAIIPAHIFNWPLILSLTIYNGKIIEKRTTKKAKTSKKVLSLRNLATEGTCLLLKFIIVLYHTERVADGSTKRARREQCLRHSSSTVW